MKRDCKHCGGRGTVNKWITHKRQYRDYPCPYCIAEIERRNREETLQDFAAATVFALRTAYEANRGKAL